MRRHLAFNIPCKHGPLAQGTPSGPAKGATRTSRRALVVPNAKAHRRGAVGLGGKAVVCKERGGGGAFLVASPQIPRHQLRIGE
jgi:hypothetical protein